MTTLAIRNLKIFFRDRASVFFSLLAVLIILTYTRVFGRYMVRDAGCARCQARWTAGYGWALGGNP